MLNKYISNLLNENKRVIIPQLGAFILKKQGEAEVVNFNSILKFDDKKLTKAIAEGEGMDEKKAQDTLKSSVTGIQDTLKKGDQYIVEGLGSIYQDANGRIQFLAAKETPGTTQKKAARTAPTPATTTAAKEAPKAPVEEQKKETKTEEKKNIPPPASATAKPEEKKVIDNTPNQQASTPKTLNEKIMEQKKAAQEKEQPSTTKKPEPTVVEAKPTSNPSAKTTAKPVPPPPAGTKKKSNKTFLLVSLVVLFMAIGVTVYLLLADMPEKDNDLLLAMEEETEITLGEEQDADELSAYAESPDENEEEFTENTEEKTVSPATTTPQTTETGLRKKYFYVVAGCFQKEQNANNYLEKLQNEGFQSEKFGMVRGMHAISYSRHEDRQEALNALQNIRREREPNAWIIQH